MCRAARSGLVLRWLVVLGTTPTSACVSGTTVVWVGCGYDIEYLGPRVVGLWASMTNRKAYVPRTGNALVGSNLQQSDVFPDFLNPGVVLRGRT